MPFVLRPVAIFIFPGLALLTLMIALGATPVTGLDSGSTYPQVLKKLSLIGNKQSEPGARTRFSQIQVDGCTLTADDSGAEDVDDDHPGEIAANPQLGIARAYLFHQVSNSLKKINLPSPRDQRGPPVR